MAVSSQPGTCPLRIERAWDVPMRPRPKIPKRTMPEAGREEVFKASVSVSFGNPFQFMHGYIMIFSRG